MANKVQIYPPTYSASVQIFREGSIVMNLAVTIAIKQYIHNLQPSSSFPGLWIQYSGSSIFRIFSTLHLPDQSPLSEVVVRIAVGAPHGSERKRCRPSSITTVQFLPFRPSIAIYLFSSFQPSSQSSSETPRNNCE